MKLQAKFTLHFIGLVLITIVVSFFLIHWSFESQFHRFIDEKNQEWGIIIQKSQAIPGSPLRLPTNGFVLDLSLPQSPETRFLRTVNDSLLWAGVIDVIFAIVLAYFISNLLLKRIFRLQLAMHHYMEDGVSKPVLHDANDEVDDLATLYNQLIAKVEKEERIRRDFFVDMSHELRTPLTSIKGYLEGLIDGVFDEKKAQNIQEKTLTETDRMIRLVKEMSSLAKLETEEVKLSREEVDLAAASEEVAALFKDELEKNHLQLEIEGSVHAQVDAFKWKQVMINLFDNAIHYSRPESTINVIMGSRESKFFWRIQNVPRTPIKAEDLDHFFERFYRADKARRYDAQKPHLGIGLNIVKKIVEQHGGNIQARLEGDQIVFEVMFG